MELIKPVLAVGEQVMKHLGLAVVKAERAPCGVLMTVARQEILVGITGQVTQTLILILDRMRVYQVHDDRYAHTVGRIYQFLEFFRGSETG